MIWVGRDLKADPWQGHLPLSQAAPALSSLALDTCRDPGAATASLGTQCQGQGFLPSIPSNPRLFQFDIKAHQTPDLFYNFSLHVSTCGNSIFVKLKRIETLLGDCNSPQRVFHQECKKETLLLEKSWKLVRLLHGHRTPGVQNGGGNLENPDRILPGDWNGFGNLEKLDWIPPGVRNGVGNLENPDRIPPGVRNGVSR
ncbi:hypothetical protein TURU_147898 [Turdus rufiventris]|nr:hypothetical protein TURU_147898 [Turdus rufiventris]